MTESTTTSADSTVSPAPATPPRTAPQRKKKRFGWGILIGLLLLSLVPIVAGATRLTELSSNPAITPDNERFVSFPVPIELHIVSVTLFAILGAIQLTPGIRRRFPNWHRWAGRLVVAPAGIVAALSGLWMSQFSELPAHDGTLLYWFRWVVGLGMIASIVLAVIAVRRHDIPNHASWMIRAYALALGAGTQVFTILPVTLLVGDQDPVSHSLLMGLGWAINLAVAEWIIRTRVLPRGRSSLRFLQRAS